jgi:hypothetical protein
MVQGGQLYVREGDEFCEEDKIECAGLSRAEGSKKPVRTKLIMEEGQRDRLG